jgi:RIO kinase 1
MARAPRTGRSPPPKPGLQRVARPDAAAVAADAAARVAANVADARGGDETDQQPLLDADDLVQIASNDEWAYRRADRLVADLPFAKKDKDADRRTEAEVFDRPTLLTLHKMLVHGMLKSVDFPISTGKEANVFRGTTPGGGYLAIKIYRSNTATFRNVQQYIQGDERFAGTGKDKRALVAVWCQKEYRNLIRLREAGVAVPEAIKASANVLVTEYLGKPEGPWPQLRLVEPKEPERLWEQAVMDYVKGYNLADLVHADWSEYNVLVENADGPESTWRLRTIDVGQAVLKDHPMAHEFAQRDIKNMVRVFRKWGVDARPEAITGQLDHKRSGRKADDRLEEGDEE